MSSHIGIVGVSPEGAALFYQSLTRHAGRLCPPDQHPRLTVHNEPLAQYIDAIRRDDWMAVGRLLRRSAELLARCGVQFCITPDAAVQHAVQLAEVGSPVPWLTMTELVGSAVAAENRKTVGIIGTELVMNSSTFQTHLGLKGIHVLTPEHDDARLLDDIIFRELIFGTIRSESRATVVRIIDHLAQRGCDGVVIACSEAPLLISRENSPLPLYDAGEILAEACVKRPVSEAVQP
ncbi:MAG: aspartate/glutamate racemase family protein [Phycisphaeraceae bacterium]|nr:aspartate/glutamate racemase family protein [Phycisphaeraceae bacterium]